MEQDLHIDVATLDAPHRRALEEVIGRQLLAHQRLIISVTSVDVAPSNGQRPAQTLDDWTHVYDGLSEEEIEAVDKVVKKRANLTRDLPSPPARQSSPQAGPPRVGRDFQLPRRAGR